jgi:hypothetical protein
MVSTRNLHATPHRAFRSASHDPVTSLVTGLPPGLAFRTKGQLAIDICADAYADGVRFDVVCGAEVYGASTELRGYLESRGQAYVLRVASNFTLTLAGGTAVTCAQAIKTLLKDKRSWEVRSAGQGSKGQRWYAWAWIGAASPRHCLLIRRHLKTGELAFHYCHLEGAENLCNLGKGAAECGRAFGMCRAGLGPAGGGMIFGLWA